jgi:peptidoglycan/LPS O-acetylase OafA/YrhL
MEHQPALDGVRGVAIVLVLLFHGGVRWMSGGYLGVSVFFTLSGFLITSLLDHEHAATGRIDIGRFLARRARRLLPASTACLAGVAALAASGWYDGVSNLRRDALGAMLQVQNWVLLAGGDSYTELLARTTGRPSPLEHYWSLAIEEQFYWLWPLAFGGLVVLARRTGRGVVGIVGIATALAVVAAPVTAAVSGPDAAYWASPARAAEILVGALLAVVTTRRAIPAATARWGLPALAAIVGACVAFPADGGPAYRGALPLVAVVSATLIATLQHDGLARRLLSWRPLVAVGAISYGLYLYHWPVFVALDEARVGRDGLALLSLRLSVTLAVAVVSYAAVERPIRRATWSPRPTLAAAVAALVLVAAVTTVVPAGADDAYWTAADDPASPAAVLAPADTDPLVAVEPVAVSPADATGSASAPGDVVPAALVAPSRPVRIVVVGDSTAESLGNGMVAWAAAEPDIARVHLLVVPGCGFLRGGEVPTDDAVPFRARCDEILDEQLPSVLRAGSPDIVLLYVTSRDVEDHVFPDDGLIGPLDAAYQARLASDYRALTDRILAESAAHVVWVRPPRVNPFWLGQGSVMSDEARHAIVDATMADLAAAYPARVHLLDLRTWTEQAGIDDDRTMRPDGLHWTTDAAAALTASWLGPQLVTIALGR